MVLRRSEKEQLVSELASLLRAASSVAVASFRDLPMVESAKLRRALRASGGHVRVVPKRLFRRVVAQLQWPASLAETSDSLAVAWTEGPAKLPRGWSPDLLAPAKGIHAYIQATEGAAILGGILEGTPLTREAVERLALLPSLETLRANLVSVLAGPLRGLAGVCGAVLRGLPALLQAKANVSS